MLITSLALLLLNYFSAKTTRELMFRAKYASAQDKIQVVASAFSGVDPLTPESAEQVISVLGNINAARLIVTNAEGTAVYDSSENQNAIGQRVLLPAVVEALRGSDVFHSAYQDDALVSSAAVPIMDHDSPNGCVYLMDKPEVILKKFKRAVTDSETCVRYDPANKPGIANLMQIYSAATGADFAAIEREFEGRGYGDFKTAVGESVVELCRPIREEANRLLQDKAYLESVYRAGAEKAGYIANKTLRKVYKKVGFVAR